MEPLEPQHVIHTYRVRRTVGEGRHARGVRWTRVIGLCLVSAVLGGGVGGWAVAQALQRTAQPAMPAPVASEAARMPVAIPQAQVSVEYHSAVSAAASKAGPAVVGVINQIKNRGKYEEVGTGSGVVFDRDRGLLVTNHHVIRVDRRLEAFQRLVVKTADNQYLVADIVGSDALTDLAVLRIQPGQGQLEAAADFGDSGSMKVGDAVLAIGNPGGLEFERTVTAGIISGVNRELPIETDEGAEATLQVLQTDAAINPGNSGGALVNLSGQVIGINSVKIARQGFEGMGFAIPINFARPVINDLVDHGRVLRPILGIYAFPNRAQQYWQTGYDGPGLIVSNVIRGHPADSAGLQPGDILLSIGDQQINRFGDLSLALGRYRPGDQVAVTVRRVDRQNQTQDLTLVVILAGPEA